MADSGDIIEAPETWLKKFCPKGIPACGFIDYKGVRACLKGKIKDVEDYLARNQEEVVRERAPREFATKSPS